jgi:predicted nuclease of restriction endonuclease-like RecB superfamily
VLSHEHVRARVKDGALSLVRPKGKQRERLVELAEMLLLVAQDHVGRTRGELTEALGQVEVGPSERKVMLGLVKLIEDAAVFDEVDGTDAAELRAQVFTLAAAKRRAAGSLADIARERMLAEIAATLGRTPEAIDALLFADLRSAQVLQRAPAESPEALARAWETGQTQAVLLRATRIVADVRTRSALELRGLFRRLKFHRMLHRIEALPDGRHRVEIDGPYSLFESVTKYGLELALLLPVLEESGLEELVAEVRWGKERKPLTFRHAPEKPRGNAARPASAATAEPPAPDVPLVAEVRELMTAFRELETPWTVELAHEVIELPGVGTCLPDLVFRHPKRARPVFLEVLGFWSREAVWKRVELAEAGLEHAIVFAASARLRVSEAVIDPDLSAALYVYKGVMSPRALEKKLELVVRRG